MRFGALLLVAASPVLAAVTGIYVEDRSDVLNRRPFGLAGPYERIEAKVHYAIDPSLPANKGIAGLDQAPRDERGMVVFTGDLVVFKPSDPRRGNGTLLIDIVNRGNATALSLFQYGQRADAEFGDHFLFEQGFTIAAIGWQYDLEAAKGLLRLDTRTPGLGLAAVRDLASFLRRDGSGIHVLGDQPAFLKRAMAFGVSQSGRFLRHFLYEGFNTDEKGRQALDGVWADVAGAARGSFNIAGAKPGSVEPADLFDNPPYQVMPEKNAPKMFQTFSSTEYWVRAASLLHTTTDGTKDLETPQNMRLYFLAGAFHGSRNWPPRKAQGRTHLSNPLDRRPVMRALLVRFDEWLRDGTAPPPSRVPLLSKGELTADVDPKIGRQPDGTRVLAPKRGPNGNELGGVALPEVAVPLGVYAGWNGPTLALDGSWRPLAPEQIRKRYANREAYLDQTAGVIKSLVAEGFLLERDVQRLFARALISWHDVTAGKFE